MKVIYFSQDYNTHDYRILEKLGQSGYDVWHVRFEANPVPLEGRPLPDGVRVADWRGSRTYRLGMWGQAGLFRDFKRLLRELRPDLVHAGPIQSCGFFTALSGFRPCLLMTWGYDVLATPEKGRLWRWMTRFTIRRADMIVADCLTVRDKILKLAPYPADRIAVFPYGVSLDQFHPAPSTLRLREKLGWQDKKVIINTRSWEPIYGVDTLLQAVRDVSRQDPSLRVLMVGGGSLEPWVREFIGRHGLEAVVHLAGRCPHHLLPHYFNEADLFVSSSYVDGASISLLEAMACRLPVIATDISSNREWVTPGVNGWLVPPGDAGALSAVLVEALANKDRWRSMGEANLAAVRERADWDKNFPLLLQAYERVTENSALLGKEVSNNAPSLD